MVLYDKSYNILGMGNLALEILGCDSFDEFIKEYGSLDEIVYSRTKDHEFKSVFESILKSAKKQRVITIKRKNGSTASVIARVYQIYMLTGESAYELNLSITNENIAQDDSNNSKNNLRLPNLLASKANQAASISPTREKLDAAWLERVRYMLDISDDELFSYLNDFLHNAQKAEISLQNAMLSNDKVSIDKITKRLEKIAQNFHITPLATTYESIRTAGKHEYQNLLAISAGYLSNLAALLNKEGK